MPRSLVWHPGFRLGVRCISIVWPLDGVCLESGNDYLLANLWSRHQGAGGGPALLMLLGAVLAVRRHFFWLALFCRGPGGSVVEWLEASVGGVAGAIRWRVEWVVGWVRGGGC